MHILFDRDIAEIFLSNLPLENDYYTNVDEVNEKAQYLVDLLELLLDGYLFCLLLLF
jgi:hypothetical protein